MPCHTPILVASSNGISGKKPYPRDVYVPCGSCVACKKRRVTDWCIRLEEEDKVSFSSFFITLTYDTDSVPLIAPNGRYPMTLKQHDHTLFVKNLRKTNSRKIRYYMCGEYGSERKRPHFHYIMFNLDIHDFNFLGYDKWGNMLFQCDRVDNAWQNKGRIEISTIGDGAFGYVAGYINKDSKVPAWESDKRVPEFSRMSQGLGSSYLTPQVIEWHRSSIDRNYYQRGKHKFPLPRYYRRKIWDERELRRQTSYIQTKVDQNLSDTELYLETTYENPPDVLIYNRHSQIGEYKSFYKRQNSRDVTT